MRELPILFSGPMVRAILSNTKTMTRRVVKRVTYDDIPDEPKPIACVKDWDGGPSRLDMMTDGTECAPYAVGDRLYVRETARLIEVDDGSMIASGVGQHSVRLLYGADLTESDWLPYPDRLAARELGEAIAYGCYREAARIWLEVTGVRCQRVQEITEEGAEAEGIAELVPADCRKDGLVPAACVLAAAAVVSEMKRPTRRAFLKTALAASLGFVAGAKPWEVANDATFRRPPTKRELFQILWDKINGHRPGCSWGDNPWLWCYTFKVSS